MKNFIKTHYIAIIATVIVLTFAGFAGHHIYELTKSGAINWNR